MGWVGLGWDRTLVWSGWEGVLVGLEIQVCWRFHWVRHWLGLRLGLGWDSLVIYLELAGQDWRIGIGLEIWMDWAGNLVGLESWLG